MKISKQFLARSILLTLASFASAGGVMASSWQKYDEPNNFYKSYNVDLQGNPIRYETNLSQLPMVGVLNKENTPWSDSYWPKQLNGFAYRWHQFQSDSINQTMTDSERQNKFFGYRTYSRNDLLSMKDTAEGQAIIDSLSPLEKFSIYVGDYNYNILRKFSPGQSWNHPSWEGYCHDWAPVATHYTEPAPNAVVNADGIKINFGSSDVKALLMASYQESRDFGVSGWLSRHLDPSKNITSYIGKGCGTKIKFLYPALKMKNGLPEMGSMPKTDGLMDADLEQNVRDYQENVKRVMRENPNSPSLTSKMRADAYDTSLASKAREAASQPACSGVNAGTFHLVITNQIGINKVGFELDKTRDGEIWNQPARGYSSKILGYSAPSASSALGTVKVATVQTELQYADDTDYGWSFNNATVKGLSSDFDLSKSQISSEFAPEFDLFNRMLKNQGDETGAYPANIMDSAHYQYTLDLDAAGNIIGGDWLTLDRPDTLWIMQKQGFSKSFSRLSEVYVPAKL